PVSFIISGRVGRVPVSAYCCETIDNIRARELLPCAFRRRLASSKGLRADSWSSFWAGSCHRLAACFPPRRPLGARALRPLLVGFELVLPLVLGLVMPWIT